MWFGFLIIILVVVACISAIPRLLTRLLTFARRRVNQVGWVSLSFDAPIRIAFFEQRKVVVIHIQAPRLLIQPFSERQPPAPLPSDNISPPASLPAWLTRFLVWLIPRVGIEISNAIVTFAVNDEAIAAVSLQAFRFGVDFDLIPLHFQPTQATTLLFATAETSAPKLKKHSSNRPGQFSTSSSAADIEYISALTLRTQFDGFRIKLRSSKLAQTNQTSHNVVSRLDTVLHTAPIDLSISFPISDDNQLLMYNLRPDTSRVHFSCVRLHSSLSACHVREVDILQRRFVRPVVTSPHPPLEMNPTTSNSALPPEIDSAVRKLPESILFLFNEIQFDLGSERAAMNIDSNSSTISSNQILSTSLYQLSICIYRSITDLEAFDRRAMQPTSSLTAALKKLSSILSRAPKEERPVSTTREMHFTACVGLESLIVSHCTAFDSEPVSEHESGRLLEVSAFSGGFRIPLTEANESKDVKTAEDLSISSCGDARINVASVSLFIFPSAVLITSIYRSFNALASSAPPSSLSSSPSTFTLLYRFVMLPLNIEFVVHTVQLRVLSTSMQVVVAASTEELIINTPVSAATSDSQHDDASYHRGIIASWSSLRICALPPLGAGARAGSGDDYEFDPLAPVQFIPFFQTSASALKDKPSAKATVPGDGHWFALDRVSFLLQVTTTLNDFHNNSLVDLDIAMGLSQPCVNVDVAQLDALLKIACLGVPPFLSTISVPMSHDASEAPCTPANSSFTQFNFSPEAESTPDAPAAKGATESMWTVNWRLEVNRAKLFVTAPEAITLSDTAIMLLTCSANGGRSVFGISVNQGLINGVTIIMLSAASTQPQTASHSKVPVPRRSRSRSVLFTSPPVFQAPETVSSKEYFSVMKSDARCNLSTVRLCASEFHRPEAYSHLVSELFRLEEFQIEASLDPKSSNMPMIPISESSFSSISSLFELNLDINFSHARMIWTPGQHVSILRISKCLDSLKLAIQAVKTAFLFVDSENPMLSAKLNDSQESSSPLSISVQFQAYDVIFEFDFGPDGGGSLKLACEQLISLPSAFPPHLPEHPKTKSGQGAACTCGSDASATQQSAVHQWCRCQWAAERSRISVDQISNVGLRLFTWTVRDSQVMAVDILAFHFKHTEYGPDSPNAGFDGRCASFTLDRYLEFGDAIDAMLLLWRALKSWKRTLQSRPLLPSFFELPFKTGNDSDAADDGLIEHSVWKHDIVVPFQPYVHSPANICTPAAPIDLGYASFLIHAEEFIFELDDAPLDIAQRIKRKMTLSSVVMMFEEAIRKRYHSLPRVLPSWLQSENSESKLYEPISIGVAANAQKTDDEPPPPPADLNENVDIPMVPSPLLRSASQPNPNIPPLPLDEPDAALQLQKTHTSDLSGLATANHLASLHRQWLNILTMNPSIRASDDSDHAAESVPSSQSKDAVAQPLKRAKTASVSFQSDSASGSDIEFPTHETSEFEVHAAQQRLDAIQAAHDRQAESARQQQLRKFQSEMKHVLRLECNDFRFGLTLKPEWLEPQAISNLLRESDPDSFADSVRDGRTSDNQVRLELFREIWARYFLLSSSETKLSLRDHPIPMLLSRSFSLRGSVLAAQMRPPDARFLLLKQLNITPTLSVIVDRGEHLQPLLKVYHQLQLDATDARISYSPSYEQALESGSQALGRIGTSPEVALGGKLDWWDNARYRFHGKLQINLNRSIIRLVSGPSPYATDHFALEFEKLQLSFATGSFKMVASDACGFIRSDEDLLIESQEYHRKKDLVAHFDSIDDGLDGVPSFSTNDFVSFGDLPFADRNTQQTPVASVPNVVLVLKFEWILESSSLSQILPLQKLHDLHHFIWTKKAFQSLQPDVDMDIYRTFRARALRINMQATALPSTAEIHKAVSQPPGAKISLQIQSLIWLQRWYALFFEPPTPILTSAPRTQTSVVKKLSFGGLIDKFTLKVCLRQTSLELRHTVLVPADDPVAQLQNLTRVDARGIDLDASEVEMSMDLLRVKVPLSDSSVQEAYRLDETIDYFTRFDTLNFCTRAVGVRTRMFVQHIGSFGADGLQEAQKELMALLAQTNRTSAVKQMDALDDSQDTEDLFQSNTSLEHFSSFDVHREPCSAAVAFKRIVDPSDITEPSNEDFGGDLASRAGRHESFFFSASLINYRSPYVLHETQPVKPGNMSNTPNINATPANPWALMPFSGDVSRFSAIKPTGLFRQTTKNMFSPTSLLSAGSVFSEPPDFNLSHSSIPQHISSYSGKLNLPAPAVPTLAIASLNSKSKAGGQSLLERRKLGNNLTIPVSAAAAADSAAPNLFLPTPSPTFSSLESASSEKELEGPAEAHRWAVHDCHILWTVSIRAATLEWTTTWRDFLRQRSQHEAREQVEPLKAEVKRALRAKRQQNMSTDAETKVGHQAMDLSVLKILANRRSKFQSHRNSLNMQALRSTLHLQEEEAAPVAPAPEPIPEDTEFILPKSAAAEDISSKLTDVVPAAEHLTQTASSVLSYFTSVDSSARRRVLVPNSVDGSTFSTLPSAPMLRFLAESTTEDHLFSDDDGGGDLSQLTRSVRRNSLEDDEPLRRSPAQTPVHSAVKEPAKDTKQSVKKSNAAGDRDESLWQSFPLTNQQYIPASMEPTRYSYSEVDGKLHYDFNLEDPLKALERQHSDNAEQYQQLYFVEFTRPQINFQSAESNSRVVLASTTAYVQGGGCPVVEPQLNNESEPKLRRSLSDDFIHAQTLFGNLSSIAENISVPPMSATQSAQSRTSFRFPESPFENIPQSDHNVSFGSQISDKSPFLNSSVLQLPFASKSKPSCYKEEISTILFGTQLFVSPVDVDITAGLQWIPKHMFESGGDAVQSISDAQNIILRRIVEPCPVLFNYSYDVDVAHALLGDATLAALKLLSKPARRRVLQRFRRQLTHSTQLFVPTFVADTNPEQFQGLIDVINGVLLSNESKAADAEVDSGRKMTHKARRHMKKRAMESFQRQLGEKGRKPAQGDKITVDEVYGASQFTGDSDASDFDSSESDSGSDADDIDDREERDMARQHGRHSSLVLLDDDVPTLPESESELQALLEIGLKAKADAEKAIEEEMASDALDKLKLSGRSDSVRPAASTQSKVQRQVMSVVQYGLADARWTLRDVFGQKLVTASMNGLLGQHSFRQDDSRLTEFDIDNMELNSCIQQALFTKLLTPLDGLWQLRDKKRDRIFSFRSEIRPPPPATLDEFPALRNIQFFDHVEINLFPLTIRLPHDHYAPFRRFFFPADLRQDAVEDATKDKFLPAHGASFSVAAPQLSTASRRAMLVYKPSNSAVPDRQPAVSRSASVKRYNTAIVRRRTTKRMTKSVAVPPKSNSSNEALAIASGAAISGAMPAMLKALNSMHAQTLSSQLDLAARQQSASVASTSAKSHRKHVGLKTAAAQKLLGATSANHVELEAERVWREERRAAREREHRRRRAGELQCYYFRYLRIGEIEMRLSYKGGLIDVDDRALFVQPFVASSKLFSFNKLFREYEVHVGFDALRSVTGSSEVSSRWTSLKNAVRPLVNWDADDVPQTPRAAAARAALPSTGKKKKSFSLVKWLGFEKEKSEDDDDALSSANQDAAQQALLDEVMTAKRAELLLGPRR